MNTQNKKSVAKQSWEIDEKLKALEAQWDYLDREGSQADKQYEIVKEIDRLREKRKTLEG